MPFLRPLMLCSLIVARAAFADAAEVVAQYEKAAAAIRLKAETEIEPLKAQAVAKLKVLQDTATRAAELDEALAIREQIRRVLGLNPDPGVLHLATDDIGKTVLFEVVGSDQGSVWGTEVFTSDSQLSAACVHAGLLKLGQRAVVAVHVIGGQQKYSGTTKNGVTSQGYGPWPVSFTVAPGPALPR